MPRPTDRSTSNANRRASSMPPRHYVPDNADLTDRDRRALNRDQSRADPSKAPVDTHTPVDSQPPRVRILARPTDPNPSASVPTDSDDRVSTGTLPQSTSRPFSFDNTNPNPTFASPQSEITNLSDLNAAVRIPARTPTATSTADLFTGPRNPPLPTDMDRLVRNQLALQRDFATFTADAEQRFTTFANSSDDRFYQFLVDSDVRAASLTSTFTAMQASFRRLETNAAVMADIVQRLTTNSERLDARLDSISAFTPSTSAPSPSLAPIPPPPSTTLPTHPSVTSANLNTTATHHDPDSHASLSIPEPTRVEIIGFTGLYDAVLDSNANISVMDASHPAASHIQNFATFLGFSAQMLRLFSVRIRFIHASRTSATHCIPLAIVDATSPPQPFTIAGNQLGSPSSSRSSPTPSTPPRRPPSPTPTSFLTAIQGHPPQSANSITAPSVSPLTSGHATPIGSGAPASASQSPPRTWTPHNVSLRETSPRFPILVLQREPPVTLTPTFTSPHSHLASASSFTVNSQSSSSVFAIREECVKHLRSYFNLNPLRPNEPPDLHKLIIGIMHPLRLVYTKTPIALKHEAL